MSIAGAHGTGTLQDIEHIVVFMQENRSFDHYFGLLDGVRGFGDPRPLHRADGGTVWRQRSLEHPDGEVLPFHGDSRKTNAFVIEGSGQSHQDNLTILNDGRCDRWGESGELFKRMAHFAASDLAYYYALASAFTVCDAYHCSTLTQTYPNRLHLWTGCNGGGTVGGDPIMPNYGEHQTPTSDQATDQPIPGGALTYKTYAERLEAAGVSWKVYQEYDNFQDNILAIFAPFRPAPMDSALYRRGRSWVSEHDPDPGRRTQSDGSLLVEAFRRDVAGGTLPQVSWIVTAEELSEHPAAAPAQGERICARLIEALVDTPEVFGRTVFIVNYDEAGGFFDHMPPPAPPVRAQGGHSTVSVDGEVKTYAAGEPHEGRNPIGLGIRVPAIIVSPWSRGGYVASEVFDHTSVLRLMERRFGVLEPNISPWRRSVCGDLTSTFDFARPNRDWTRLTLPATNDFLERSLRSQQLPQLVIPDRQSATHQSGARRRSRPTPYVLAVEVGPADGRWELRLENRGQAGAVFQVYDEEDDQGPWRYTVGADERHVAVPWTTMPRACTVHGPDGFYRRFGHICAAPIIARITWERAHGAALLSLHSQAEQRLNAELRMADGYGDLLDPSRIVALPAGRNAAARVDLSGSTGWYDLSVRLAEVPDFELRLAGRLRTGRAALTDPGIGPMVL